ncbi:MAG TPA: oligosaccharide flippase family protein, partial [Blastocatellia bacterium]|nr:oligosaccharide flippase family protein [Blastocatellia bacterium]
MKQFFKDSFIYTISYVASRAVSLFLLPLYTRALSPEDYGVLELFSMFSTAVCLLLPLEISQGMARFYAGSSESADRSSYISTAFWFTTLLFAAFIMVGFAFASPLSALVLGGEMRTANFQIGVLTIASSAIFSIAQGAVRWKLRSLVYSLAAFVSLLSATLSSAVFVLVFKWQVNGVLLGLICGNLLGLAVCLPCLRSDLIHAFRWQYMKEMLKFSSPLVLMQIGLLSVNYSDRLLIQGFLGLEALGIYGVAYKFASITQFVMIGIQTSAAPLIMNAYQQRETPKQI